MLAQHQICCGSYVMNFMSMELWCCDDTQRLMLLCDASTETRHHETSRDEEQPRCLLTKLVEQQR